MEPQFKTLIIYNESELVNYIEKTSEMSEMHKRDTTNLVEIKRGILAKANEYNSDIIDKGFQIECMKGWDKVHLFKYKAHFKSELSVVYRGTIK